MADSVGFPSLDALIDATVPKSTRIDSMEFSKFDEGLTETQMLAHMKYLADKNKLFESFIGMGYYNTSVPAVILCNIMENPGWYTQYTPYQDEIAQGRLESFFLNTSASPAQPWHLPSVSSALASARCLISPAVLEYLAAEAFSWRSGMAMLQYLDAAVFVPHLQTLLRGSASRRCSHRHSLADTA